MVAAPPIEPASPVDEPLVLSLKDLLPDAAGEVVMYAGDGVPVNLVTHAAIAESGVAAPHVTAAGIDVTGLSFHSFATGLTVYYPPDLPLTVSQEI